MYNILLKLNSNQLREILFKTFEKVDENLYTFKKLKIGIIDGSTFSKHFASAFQFYSDKAPYVIDLEKYKKRGKEIPASKRLIKRLVSNLGNKFVDLVLADGLYKLDMMKFLKKYGINILIKTSEKRLAPIEELNLLKNSKIGEDIVQKTKDTDTKRNEEYEIYSIEYDWEGEKVKVAKVTEEKLKAAQKKGEPKFQTYYIITNQVELSMHEMRELAKKRWNIENNGFKQLSQYANTKHEYSKNEKVIENLMLIYFLSYNIMRQFKKAYDEEEKPLSKHLKCKESFQHFVRIVGLLSEIIKLENTS